MNLQNISPTLRRHDSEPGGGASPEGGRGKSSDPKRSAGDAVRQAGEQIKSAARDVAHEAREKATHAAEEQKDRAARHVGGYGSAMHSAASEIEGEDPNIAWVTHRVADRIQRAADYLRESDFSRLQSDLEDVARRNPLVFFGGLFVAGLVLGNLVTATAGDTAMSRSDADAQDEEAATAADSPYSSNPAVQGTDSPGATTPPL